MSYVNSDGVPADATRVLKEAIASAATGREVPAPIMSSAMQAILGGYASAAQMAALLVALRMKGETTGELSAAAQVMREHAVKVQLSPRVRAGALVDTCGTGGDGGHTFNISTAAAVVVAAAGVPVAKHGNRAATSQTGSADVLEALGVRIDCDAAGVARCIENVGIGFMFARSFHPAMRHVAAVRGEIGVRTLFNFLGPLANPASATHQVIGVSEPRMMETMAGVLARLGGPRQRALVVHGHGSLDEIAVSGPTKLARLQDGAVTLGEVAPEDFGLVTQPNADLSGGDATRNAALIRGLFGGERGARRDAVVINAAAALQLADAAPSLRAAADLAQSVIDSGAAMRVLDAWVTASKGV